MNHYTSVTWDSFKHADGIIYTLSDQQVCWIFSIFIGIQHSYLIMLDTPEYYKTEQAFNEYLKSIQHKYIYEKRFRKYLGVHNFF